MKLKKRSNGRNVKSRLESSNTPVNFHERGRFFLENPKIIRLFSTAKNSRYGIIHQKLALAIESTMNINKLYLLQRKSNFVKVSIYY